MQKKWRLILPLAALLGLASCGEEEKPVRNCLPFHSGDIVLEPEIFNFSDIKSHNGITFTPNGCELYIANDIANDIDGVTEILKTGWSGRLWTEPEPVELISSPFDDDQPRLTPDGSRLYFNSSRPMPSSKEQDGLQKLWYIEQGEEGWTGPHYLTGVNSSDPSVQDGFAAPLSDGSLYFRSTRASGDTGNGDIFFAKFNGATFEEPVLVRGISSPRDETGLAVTPGNKVMILNRTVAEPEDTYLMVSIRDGNRWGIPRAVEAPASQFRMETTPTVSPDGLYFLYEVRGVVFIVDLHTLLNDAELAKLGVIRRGTEED